MILDRYFARRFFWTFAGVFGVFFLILAFIGLVEQLRRLSNFDASFADVLRLSALSLPEALYGILPLVMIIATITLFLGLARSSEMVVTRAAGRGALRAMVPPLIVALMIGIFAVAILNPIVAATSKQFEVQNDAIRGEGSVLSIGATGLWLRQGNEDSQTVIHAESANLNGTEMRDATFTTFSPDGVPTRRITAETAELQEGEWVLTNVKSWPLFRDGVPEASATYHETLTVPSTLTPDQIRDSFGTPSSIPIWDLPAFIQRLQKAGFSAQRHQVWFQMELALPLFLVSMVLIGAAFTLRHQRGGRTGLMVMLAIMLSFGIYFLRNFSQILGENGQIPAVLAAWAPPLAAIGLAMGLLLHNEDG
ncbi:lipopolysaccharide export system permease protein [Cognatiyoonia sediminum]|uniref:Lipopolysaccharide export system permease protein n=1 Tax=Cognatiyoonia sediminum TaxID=1508389 RepID=A0A1M5LYN1_9RHOB|nr:LPS export ABC transporter permease LptG [Cognatiyoonia sediminum]SHG69759.1 lipopolysaccharide export system permease protein [Cognatiyoonia sediminum]